jgi:hypothetical protein
MLKTIVFSKHDHGTSKLTKGTLYLEDSNSGFRLRSYAEANDGRNWVSFIPDIINSPQLESAPGEDSLVRIGDMRLVFSQYGTDSTLLAIDNTNSVIEAGVPIAFTGDFGINFANGDVLKKNPVKWTQIADVTTTSTVPLPAGYATVADLVGGAIEGMIVARVGNEYVSSVIPAAAISSYPAEFPIHQGAAHVASFTFNAATDTSFGVTVTAADQVIVLMR